MSSGNRRVRRDRGIYIAAAMRETRSWWIRRIAADSYQFIRDLGGGEYYVQDWRTLTGLPGTAYTLPQFAFARAGIPMLSQDDWTATFAGTFTQSSSTLPTSVYQPLALVGNMTATSTTLALTGGGVVALPNDKTRKVTVAGAGAAGADLVSTISSSSADPANPKTVAAAGTTVVGAAVTLWGSYKFSTTAGDTITWVSPASATSLGVRVPTSTNGGLLKVSIDGDATLANWCPTAQQLVDAGTYPNTILVAFGGTLNPTDRVLDCYGGSTNLDTLLAIASGLAAAAHTVVLTVTGYKQAVSTAARGYISGFAYGTGAETPVTAGAEIFATYPWLSAFSAFVPVVRFTPNGGTTTTDYFSQVHGYEEQLTLAFADDTGPVVLVDGQVYAPTGMLVITQTSRCYHVDTPATVQALISTTLRLADEYLEAERPWTWQNPGTVYGSYVGMLPVQGTLNRFISSGWWAPVTLGAADGSHDAVISSWIGVCWDQNSLYAQSLEMVDAFTLMAGWAHNTNGNFIEDRAPSSGIKINKFYDPRVESSSRPETYAALDVWPSKIRYRVRRFPGGAEAALAGIAT